MCFHLFSKGNRISVEYAIEDIKILFNGQSQINIDLFLKNDGKNQIESFDIIYPKPCYEVKDNDKVRFAEDFFKDITYTILEKKNEINFRYNSSTTKIETLYEDNKTHVYKKKFTLPNHTTTFEPVYVECFVKDVDVENKSALTSLDFCALLSATTMHLTLFAALQQISFSIIRYTMKTPIEPGEVRFFRFLIGPYTTALHKNNLFKTFLLKIYNSLYLPFEIVSPYDILHRFISKAYDLKFGLENDCTVHVRDVCDLLIKYIKEEIEISDTKYKSWEIELHPDKYRILHNIVTIGNIKPLGIMPNDNLPVIDEYTDLLKRHYIFKGLYTKFLFNLFPYKVRAYDFITHNDFDDRINASIVDGKSQINLDEKYGFRIYFAVKYPSYLYKTIQLSILFILAYYVLVTSFIQWMITYIYAHNYEFIVHLLVPPLNISGDILHIITELITISTISMCLWAVGKYIFKSITKRNKYREINIKHKGYLE